MISTLVILPDGTHEWYTGEESKGVQPKLHRDDDLPAVISPSGLFWFRHGLLHRDDGKPAVMRSDGRIYYLVDGRFHRVEGPAVIYPNGSTSWYRNGIFILNYIA